MEAIEDIIEALEPYIDADGTEYGESIDALIRAWRYEEYYPEDLRNLIKSELNNQYHIMTKLYEVVEEKTTIEKTSMRLQPKQ